MMNSRVELTILMPCLNEEETIGVCIKKAMSFLSNNKIDGEILISDNGSSDDSVKIAESLGARVINAPVRGYGGALIAGCANALGKYVIMGDADDSYDFEKLMPFLEKLRDGYDLVMGNRFWGGIEKGAMPWSHRFIGNPVLSFIGRLFFKSNIRDFHCGLRGYNRDRILDLQLRTTGMEYASEMVVMSELAGYKIIEVPTTLKKDGRSRPPHLRSFHDGWRHLKFLLMYSPRWLFLYPGIILIIVGLLGGITLSIGQMTVGREVFGIHTLLYCMISIILGVNIVYFYTFTKLYAETSNFIPKDKSINIIASIGEDKGVLIGFILSAVGLISSLVSFVIWKNTGFSEMVPEKLMRIVLPAATMLEVGVETMFASFFMGILKIEWRGKNSGKSN